MPRKSKAPALPAPALTPTLAERVANILRSMALLVIVQDADESLAIEEIEAGAAGCGMVRVLSGADDMAAGLIEAWPTAGASGREGSPKDPPSRWPEAGGVLVLCDYLSIYGENPVALRLLRQVAFQDRPENERLSRLILVERPETPIPAALLGDAEIVAPTLPTVADLAIELDAFVDDQGIELSGNGETRYELASAGAGLARHEYARLLCRCKADTGGVDAAWIRKEKAVRVATKLGGALSFEDTTKAADIGGLANLTTWLATRRAAFASERARSFGLPEPKGLLIVGVPGGGKSLAAKVTARDWGLPLLRFDPGKVFGSLVGQSESQARQAIEAAEACAPCILWIDEIEKGLAGSTGSSGDSGTSQRVFGTLLTWLQEKDAPVFVVATANRIEDMPPELLRKGRFDEIFFVDLPTESERADIARIHLARKGRDLGANAPQAIALATDGFTGAEIEQAVISGLFEAFADDRALELTDVVAAARGTTPLTETAPDDIARIRAWATKSRAVRASAPESDTTTTTTARRGGRARRRGPAKGKE